jgi:hypothetical protein
MPRRGLLLLLAALLPLAASGQNAAPNEPGRPRGDAFRMIDAYIVGNLQESLGLTDDQFGRVLPQVKRLLHDRRELAQRRQRAVQELRRVLQSGNATEAQVTDLLRELKSVAAEEPRTLGRDMEAIDGVLSPVQQAKYRIFEIEVDRKIRELMIEMRMERREGRRPRGPGRLDPLQHR